VNKGRGLGLGRAGQDEGSAGKPRAAGADDLAGSGHDWDLRKDSSSDWGGSGAATQGAAGRRNGAAESACAR
ncbi:hypothetical protein RZS08_20090, partial [Arthrospira platensis SPKY1]|nr:hypothetical protein [Arthrospira platensis SPKY1]